MCGVANKHNLIVCGATNHDYTKEQFDNDSPKPTAVTLCQVATIGGTDRGSWRRLILFFGRGVFVRGEIFSDALNFIHISLLPFDLIN